MPRCVEIAKDAPVILESLDQPCLEHFRSVQQGLDLLGVPYRIEPKMVRGLDYYTRTAFEIVHGELGPVQGCGGGGRYDSLLKELGGPDASGNRVCHRTGASGYGAYGRRPLQSFNGTFICRSGERGRDVGMRLVHDLRIAGFSVETRYSSMSLKAQMKVADKVGAAKVIMIGDDELDRKEVTVRDMVTKSNSLCSSTRS